MRCRRPPRTIRPAIASGSSGLYARLAPRRDVSNDACRMAPPNQETRPDPEEERVQIQAFLGQLHGVLKSAVADNPHWFPADYVGTTTSPGPLREAYVDCCEAFGKTQAELNTGKHDEPLSERGLTGPQRRLKFTGWLRHLRRIYAWQGERPPAALRRALNWANVMLGSLGIIPGVDLIKEFTESTALALDELGENNAESGAKDPSQ
jgi:hypothetical protein